MYFSMELGEPVAVKTAANDVKQIVYNYRESLSAGLIVGGWDRKLGGQVSVPVLDPIRTRLSYFTH